MAAAGLRRCLRLAAAGVSQLLRVGCVSAVSTAVAAAAVAPPVLTPAGGDAFAKFSVTVSCPTPGAELHYTLNGAEPVQTDPLISSGSTVLISRGWTLKVKAWVGQESSATTTSSFTLTGQVAAGGSHSLGLKGTGEVWAWGLQTDGRLGNNVTASSNISSPVASKYSGSVAIGDAAMVAAGTAHSVFLKSGGTVWAYGLNSTGALGNNSTASSGVAVQVRKSTVSTDYLTGCTGISAGNGFSAALSSTGEVYTWGSKTSGALGDGTTSGTRLYAGKVYQGTSGTTPLVGINRIAAYGQFAMGKEPCGTEVPGSSGFVWVWGANGSGQLGQGNTTSLSRASKLKLNATTFLTDALDVSCGESHSAVVRWIDGNPAMQGRVFCCGQQGNGRLGNNLTATASVTYPVQVVKTGGLALDGIVSVAAGSAHTLALDLNGNVWAWGYNVKGALGDNTVTDRATAAKVKNPAGTGDLSNIVYIAAGGSALLGHSMAVAADGKVYTWGYNANGQLGNATTSTGATKLPVAVTGSFNVLPKAPDTGLAVSVAKALAPGIATLTASPTDPDNNISKVEFYSQGVLVGQATSAPWQLTMNSLTAGGYHAYAVVSDTTGLRGYSPPVTFSIIPPSPPSVSLVCTVVSSSIPGSAVLTATPSDPDGDLTTVEFFLDGVMVGQRSAPPWTVNLLNMAEGSYSVYARATDSTGLTASSAVIPFDIGNDPEAPNLDGDGDGLPDAVELAMGTSTTDADSDGDGIPDGVDSSPLMPDVVPLSAASTIFVWAPAE